MRKSIKITFLLLGVFSILAFCGCDDKPLEITGKVYEWVNAPEGCKGYAIISIIDEDYDAKEALDEILNEIKKDHSGKIEIIVLPNATITLEEKNPIEQSGEKYSYQKVISDSEGKFGGYIPAALKYIPFLIKVSKEGYVDMNINLLNEPAIDSRNRYIFNNDIIVIMVKSN